MCIPILSPTRDPDVLTDSLAVGVPCSGLNLPVTQQLPDHLKAFFEREGPGHKDVPQVINSHVIEIGSGADAAPKKLKVG